MLPHKQARYVAVWPCYAAMLLLFPGLILAAWGRVPGRALTPELSLPRIILWAWERREDLRSIDPHQVGVAYLARTVLLQRGMVVVRPRLQPLLVPPNTVTMPVVRLQAEPSAFPVYTAGQRARVVEEMAALVRTTAPPAIQIDFDARRSERDFYRALLHDLRQVLPATTRLSITTLASWCLGDDWLADLPIDEAVSMLFRMGADRQHVLRHLQNGGAVLCAAPQSSLGVSTDEPLPRVPPRSRVYIFHPRPWSAAAIEAALEEAKQWP